MKIKVVVRYKDGTVLKGTTSDLNQKRPVFHLTDPESGSIVEIEVESLKAVFFVKSLEGNKDYVDRYDLERSGYGRRIKVHFKDGETIIGYTSGYYPGRATFFIFPPDPDCNNDRIMVIESAAKEIEFL